MLRRFLFPTVSTQQQRHASKQGQAEFERRIQHQLTGMDKKIADLGDQVMTQHKNLEIIERKVWESQQGAVTESRMRKQRREIDILEKRLLVLEDSYSKRVKRQDDLIEILSEKLSLQQAAFEGTHSILDSKLTRLSEQQQQQLSSSSATKGPWWERELLPNSHRNGNTEEEINDEVENVTRVDQPRLKDNDEEATAGVVRDANGTKMQFDSTITFKVLPSDAGGDAWLAKVHLYRSEQQQQEDAEELEAQAQEAVELLEDEDEELVRMTEAFADDALEDAEQDKDSFVELL